MRLALITTALAALAACGGDPEAAGPERRSAAGEVLGGEVSDDMLPLDTARSTSPVAARTAASDREAKPAAEGNRPERDRDVLPRPEVSGGPEPYTPGPAGVEPTDGPPSE